MKQDPKGEKKAEATHSRGEMDFDQVLKVKHHTYMVTTVLVSLGFLLILLIVIFSHFVPHDTGSTVIEVLGILLSIILIFNGINLLSTAEKHAVPPVDRQFLVPLIVHGDDKAIEQYIRLSSLTGPTGIATELELTGLPLATIFLTFSVFCP
jgi:hypothetical protein